MTKTAAKITKKTYLITCDLAAKISLLRFLGLKVPATMDSFFLDYNSELKKKIQYAMPETIVVSVDMKSLADRILEIAFKNAGSRALVISSCPEIAIFSRGYMLEINRIIDIQGKILGLGPRPGFPSLKEQMNGVASLAARRPVVLVEDGTFSGATLSYIVKELKKRNVDIVSIVVGFAFQKGRDLIKEEHEFELEVVEKNHKLLDWVPDHDFVPFSPNCGRVFGVSINEVNYPFYTHDGASYCVPYIIPFAPMKEWTSINGESDKVREEISIFCLETACELFKYIERINRKTLLIGDLVAKSPSSVSVPISVGQKKFPEQLDKPIVGYLEKIYRHGILFLDPEEI